MSCSISRELRTTWESVLSLSTVSSGDPSCQVSQQAILPTKYIFSVTSKYIDSNVDEARHYLSII